MIDIDDLSGDYGWHGRMLVSLGGGGVVWVVMVPWWKKGVFF